jgi:hypothetical protein
VQNRFSAIAGPGVWGRRALRVTTAGLQVEGRHRHKLPPVNRGLATGPEVRDVKPLDVCYGPPRRSTTPGKASMSGIFIYSILTHYTKPENLDPGFLVLDNSSNERPDWYEYWPIRKFLLNEPLDEDAFYGFLSPKFKQKTNLSSAATHDFVRTETKNTDVVLLSPSLHWTAYHLNVFEFGDAVHPGLLDLATQFFKRIGPFTNLRDLVTTSRNEVYSNYMIGKPKFWRAWLEVTEQLFEIAESPNDPLGAALRTPTTYRGSRGVHMKIFIMERVATWVLLRNPGIVSRARDPFVTRSRVYKLPGAIICDALKIAYLTNAQKHEYKDVFRLVSKFGKFFGWLIRLGNAFGVKPIRDCVTTLESYWVQAGKS